MNVAELHVDDAVGGHGAVVARRRPSGRARRRCTRRTRPRCRAGECRRSPSRRSTLISERERRDDPQRVAVRLHEQRVRVLGEQRAEAPQMCRATSAPTAAPGCRDCRCWRNMRCQRYAGAMSASSSSQRAYDGTRYCVGKIMLRKSPPVMRTHSCGSRAPIGCIAWKPGITSSTPSRSSCDLAMRGSVS